MIFRVTFSFGYNRAYFDFALASEAGEFASTALMHSVDPEDSDKETSVSIKVMNNDSNEGDE